MADPNRKGHPTQRRNPQPKPTIHPSQPNAPTPSSKKLNSQTTQNHPREPQNPLDSLPIPSSSLPIPLSKTPPPLTTTSLPIPIPILLPLPLPRPLAPLGTAPHRPSRTLTQRLGGEIAMQIQGPAYEQRVDGAEEMAEGR